MNFYFKVTIGQKNVLNDILERKNASLGYKNKKFKSWKIDIFQLLFLGNICQENGFYDSLERKNAFLGYRKKNSKNPKNSHFLKGVNPWFWSKNGHFTNFYFLGNTGQENVFYDILERRNAFLSYNDKKLKKSINWYFSKGVNPWFWTKNGHFSNFYFLGNTGQENISYDILERKNAFLGYKNNKFKKSKNWHFSKGLTHGFGRKMAIFPNFFF